MYNFNKQKGRAHPKMDPLRLSGECQGLMTPCISRRNLRLDIVSDRQHRRGQEMSEQRGINHTGILKEWVSTHTLVAGELLQHCCTLCKIHASSFSHLPFVHVHVVVDAVLFVAERQIPRDSAEMLLDEKRLRNDGVAVHAPNFVAVAEELQLFINFPSDSS